VVPALKKRVEEILRRQSD